MFTDNWYLFMLIVMLVFASDGNISTTETAVMISILFALCLTCGSSDDPEDRDRCFCGGRTTV